MFGDRLECGVGMEESEGGSESVVGDAINANAAIVLRNVFDEPVDGVVSVGSLIGGLGIGEIHLRGEVKDTLGFETPTQVLNDEDIAIVRKLEPTRWSGRGRFRRYAIRSTLEEDG